MAANELGQLVVVAACGVAAGLAAVWMRTRLRSSQACHLRSRDESTWSVRPARVICFGDSITEYGSCPSDDGWVAKLQWAYLRKADVLNRGFSGYTSRMLLRILPDLLAPLLADGFCTVAVTVMLGANDATSPSSFQHVPPNEFLKNMTAIIRELRAAFPTACVLVLSPTAVDAAAWDAHCRATYGADGGGRCMALVSEYGELAARAAAATGCLFIDVAGAMVGPSGNAPVGHLLSDGLHLSPSGQHIVSSLIEEALAAQPKAAAAGLPEFFPRDPIAAPRMLL